MVELWPHWSYCKCLCCFFLQSVQKDGTALNAWSTAHAPINPCVTLRLGSASVHLGGLDTNVNKVSQKIKALQEPSRENETT